MLRIYLLLLLLGGSASAFSQNKLPVRQSTGFEKHWAAEGLRLLRSFQQRLEVPFDLKSKIPDSLFQKWRTHEWVRDDEFPSKYLIVVTLDGMRWQEVFTGADSLCWQQAASKNKTKAPWQDFRGDSPESRRRKLMPFLWNDLAAQGQIYGNRHKNSRVSVTNKMRISYPGYNEIFSGLSDDPSIRLNFKIPNPNSTVFHYIAQCRSFGGRVASFGSWDVFPSIFNKKKGGFLINAGFEPFVHEKFEALNRKLKSVARQWGEHLRPDSLTMAYALEYLQDYSPRVLHIGLGETDEYAHEKKYADYLLAAQASDRMIAELWDFIQSSPRYRNKTTLFITTDHGRGNQPESWHKHHGWVEGAEEIWFAVLGPQVEAQGEMRSTAPLYQCQFAQSFASFVGLEYRAQKSVAAKIVFQSAQELAEPADEPVPALPSTTSRQNEHSLIQR